MKNLSLSISSILFRISKTSITSAVTGGFGPIPVWTRGRFGPIPFRSGCFCLGRFGPILEVGRFGPVLVGGFSPLYFIFFLGNKKFFLLARLI